MEPFIVIPDGSTAVAWEISDAPEGWEPIRCGEVTGLVNQIPASEPPDTYVLDYS